MKTLPILASVAFVLTACDPISPAVMTTSLPFFGDGYRAEGDQCRRVGENDFTGQYLDHTADLVGCPADMENLGVFAIDTGGVQVAETEGYVLFSVPLG